MEDAEILIEALAVAIVAVTGKSFVGTADVMLTASVVHEARLLVSAKAVVVSSPVVLTAVETTPVVVEERIVLHLEVVLGAVVAGTGVLLEFFFVVAVSVVGGSDARVVATVADETGFFVPS